MKYECEGYREIEKREGGGGGRNRFFSFYSSILSYLPMDEYYSWLREKKLRKKMREKKAAGDQSTETLLSVCTHL